MRIYAYLMKLAIFQLHYAHLMKLAIVQPHYAYLMKLAIVQVHYRGRRVSNAQGHTVTYAVWHITAPCLKSVCMYM